MRIYFPASVDPDDIYSVALLGLIGASQMFDATKGATFGHYAKLRVRGALIDEMRRLDWMPRSERANAKRYQNAVEELEVLLKREPTQGEIALKLNLEPKELEKLQEKVRPIYILPLDAFGTSSNEEEGTLHDVLPDLNQMDARDISESNDQRKTVREGLSQLEDIPKKILALYYLKGLRLAEIAQVLNLSESRVCQIHGRALANLKQFMDKKNNN